MMSPTHLSFENNSDACFRHRATFTTIAWHGSTRLILDDTDRRVRRLIFNKLRGSIIAEKKIYIPPPVETANDMRGVNTKCLDFSLRRRSIKSENLRSRWDIGRFKGVIHVFFCFWFRPDATPV